MVVFGFLEVWPGDGKSVCSEEVGVCYVRNVGPVKYIVIVPNLKVRLFIFEDLHQSMHNLSVTWAAYI